MTEKFFIELDVSQLGINEVLCDFEQRGKIHARALSVSIVHEIDDIDTMPMDGMRYMRATHVAPRRVRMNLEMDIDMDAVEVEPLATTNEEQGMQHREWNAAALLVDGLITIDVVFPDEGGSGHDSRTYTYMTLDSTIERGCAVVVPNSSKRLSRGPFKIAVVQEVHALPKIDINAGYRYKWIVQRVHEDAHQDINERMEEFTTNLEVLGHKATVRQMITSLSEDVGEKYVDDAIAKLNGRPIAIAHQGTDEEDESGL